MQCSNFYGKSSQPALVKLISTGPTDPYDSEVYDSESSVDDSVIDKDYIPEELQESDEEHLTQPSTSHRVNTNRLIYDQIELVESNLIGSSDAISNRRNIWKHIDIERVVVQSNNIRNSCPNVEILSPMQYFSQFFSDGMIDHIVFQTNLYIIQSNPNSTAQTCKNEIKDFIAILLYMGVVECPSIRDYWDPETKIILVSETMTQKRFEFLRRFIHFNDNAQQMNSNDRFYKIRPIFDLLRHNCLQIEPTRQQSVDEVMIAYKGTRAGNLRQYIANKPDKWGFKLFCRGSSNGIIHDFILYQGQTTFTCSNLSEEEHKMLMGAKVVTLLCKTLSNPGNCTVVYGDNFFTDLKLISHLKSSLNL
ncbi:unnamed protein product [Rotaria magnacalcarata]|uniref:PiggyBac transposable element-derived protein domain-containing protein n=1 Tax=Rotaria magnacalcarata TaxID=392030 RepID=A0A816PUB1_9BILA|nr:unnamed protein product [Rotaria magnacalcarata]CAF4237401.1 unnamed protein product [Rotaria magnacalcarata]